MKRVWLSIAILVASLVGGPWQGSHAMGQTDDSCPGVDMGYDGHSDCPNLEEMRTYGECPWYFDNYRHGALADGAVDATAEHEALASADDAVEAEADEASVEACPASESVVLSNADSGADCWYDCETDEYYQYEFSHVADEAVASEDVADSTTSDASAWDTEACVDEFYADEDYDCGYDWRDDSEIVMESTQEETETALSASESPVAGASDEREYNYDVDPYGYDYDHDYESHDSMPVQAWEDTDIESVEDDEAVPPAPASDLAQFDSAILLSLARTLDRVGSTLQSLSHYLTEIATAEMAQRQEDMLRR